MSTRKEPRGALSFEEADRCNKAGFKGAWAHLSTDDETLMAPWPGQWLPMEVLPRQAEDAGRPILLWRGSHDAVVAKLWKRNDGSCAWGVYGVSDIDMAKASGWAPVVLPRNGGAT